jgi:flagellar biosynthesis protein FlhA
VVRPYLNRNGDLPAYFVDPGLEHSMEAAVEHGEQNSVLGISPQSARDILNRISGRAGTPEAPVVAITSAPARYFLRQITEASIPNLVFLSHNEIPAGVKVLSLGTL